MEKSMFCYQCQEAAGGRGCHIFGVCGKDSTTANLQDALIYTLRGLAEAHQALRQQGRHDPRVANLVWEGLFSTITNANFDPAYFTGQITKTRDYARKLQKENNLHVFESFSINTQDDIATLEEKGSILTEENEDLRSLRELITYGLKGIAAYAYHASHLDYEDDSILDFVERALVTAPKENDISHLLPLVMETGKYGVKVMELLDKANTSTFGNPEPTRVNIGVRKNPGILVSGHDLKDLLMLLEQTKNSGVDIYTHSEMLPAHSYPLFKKYDHFAGNYGNAWWKQTEEFESFRGPILFTTNCIVPPKESYKLRLYTTGPVGFPETHRITENPDGTKDFSPLIEHAKKCPPPLSIEEGAIMGGFAHHVLTSLTDTILDAVGKGYIKKFVVMAGCDGRMPSRHYYTDFAQELPADTVILTAGCAKYRYNKLNLGDIHGIPRVLDAGQCNDSYSLVAAALHLQKTLGVDINDLPIIYNIAWYEQKAVIVLLALLALGVKNIRLGPTLPAFLSPTVAKFLVENFGISRPTTPSDDIRAWKLS